ncbi:MAG: hypothetical protein P8X94_02080 [Woeseiaceae bacterium]
MGMGLVENFAGTLDIPRAHRIGTRCGQSLDRGVAAGSADQVRLAAPQQLPAVVGAAQLDGHGFCRGYCREDRQRKYE